MKIAKLLLAVLFLAIQDIPARDTESINPGPERPGLYFSLLLYDPHQVMEGITSV